MSSSTRPQMRTVYPAHWIDPIIGRHTPALNQSIECWAALVATATQSLEGYLHPEDWEILARLLGDTGPSPRDPYPGRTVAQMLKEWAGFEAPAERVPHLVRLLLGLSYQQIWAIIVAVQYHRRYPHVEQWWTLEVRQEGAEQ